MTRDFAQLDGLVRLSSNKGIDIRPMLVRVLTDLYIQEPNHNREREQQYCELALRLLSAVDVQTRLAVAGKLASYAHAPQLILDHLAADVPEVARMVASAGKQDEEPQPGGSEPVPVRAPESRSATDAPRQPYLLSEPSPLAAPPAVSAALGEAFLDGDAGERAALLEKLEEDAGREDIRPPAPFSRAGALERLEQAALGSDRGEFGRELHQSFDLPRRVAARIAEDASGEALVVVARAIGMRRAVFVRVLLFLNPLIGHSVERVFALVRLYETTTVGAASRLFASWRESTLARSGAHQSVHAAGAVPSAAGLMTNARRPLETPSENFGDRRQPASPRDRRQGTT